MILHFIRPTWLLLLIPAFIYLIWMIRTYRQPNPWQAVCDPHLLSRLIKNSPPTSKTFLYCTLFIFYFLSIFALAGPAYQKESLPVYRHLRSLMLVLDLSPNMNVADIKPNRFIRAKYKIHDLINAAKNIQMGFVVFTEEAFTASPLSQDANTLNALIDELNPNMMPVIGSDSGSGLMEANRLLKQTAITEGHILLITASNPTANSWTAAKTLASASGHLHILAMLENNAANQTTITNLQHLADTGHGGFYFFSNDTKDIQTILKQIDNEQIIKSEKIEHSDVWQDLGPWLCILLLPLALLLLREILQYENS